MAHYLTLAGRRTAIVNLDPANESPPYEAAVDVADLVSLEGAMAAHGLGPNGGEEKRLFSRQKSRTTRLAPTRTHAG
jgi:hypothetical protein